MEILDPWSPVILKSSYTETDFDAVIAKWKSLPIMGNGDVERDGGQSSVMYSRETDDHPHLWPEMDGYRRHLDIVLNEVLDAWRINGVPYRPTDSWINEHPYNAWTDEHNHKGAPFVIVYYISVPDDSGTIMFRDPLEYHWGIAQGPQQRGEGNIWYRVGPVKTGDIIFFPGWLYHKTERNMNSEHKCRYVMSTNFYPLLTNEKVKMQMMQGKPYGSQQ